MRMLTDEEALVTAARLAETDFGQGDKAKSYGYWYYETLHASSENQARAVVDMGKINRIALVRLLRNNHLIRDP